MFGSNDPQDLTETILDVGSVSRRQLLKRSAVLGFSVPVVASLLAACGDDDDEDPTEVVEEPTEEAPDSAGEPTSESEDEPDATMEAEPTAESEPTAEEDEPTAESDSGDSSDQDGRFGGTLQVALVDELSTFDPHQTTATIIGYVVWHMFEHLYTYDDDFNIIPELAAGQETSDDGLTYTIPLREGVTFHNGKEMTATDVIACMERWGQLAGRGQILFEDVEEITEIDPYTIEVKLSAPNGLFWGLLARTNNGCCIYPKEVVDQFGLESIQEFIGTGPYQFVEHQPDNFIHFRRYEDYEVQGTEGDGWGGAKVAYFDEIFFRPVPDEAARAAGLLAGDYHVLQSTSPDNFQMLANDPNAVAEFLPPSSVLTIQLNTQEGPMANPVLRQAIQAALSVEPILLAAYGEGAFRMEASWMMQELAVWYTEACAEYYDQGNAERAAELLAESGYDGEPLRFTTSEHENFHINTALTAQQQLNAVGFNIEIEVYDWPTLSGEVRQDMSRWELLTSGTGIRPDPALMSPMDPQWGARWDSERKAELLDQLLTETDPDARVEIWEQVQCLGYEEDVPFINLGKPFELAAFSPKIQGYRPDLNMVHPFFWNVWLEE